MSILQSTNEFEKSTIPCVFLRTIISNENKWEQMDKLTKYKWVQITVTELNEFNQISANVYKRVQIFRNDSMKRTVLK